jgi:ATP-binding cassette subfamily F protein 3
VIEELGTAANMADVPRLRGHLGAFLFSGDDVDKRVSVLSGGEKARLALAKMLLHPTNFLVLDEPTNHLDIVACEVLEEALGQYQGTMLFVSHDRSFINALAKRVVDVRAGVLREFSGNYDDYMERLAETEARAAAVTQTEQPAARAPSSDGTARPETPPSRSKSKRADAGAHAPTADAPKLSKDERKQQRERRKQREKLARQISRIEAEIQESETELEALGWKLGDPALFRDVDLMRELTEQRDRTTLQVAERYSEWERLADELAALDDVDAPVASASGGTASD